MESRLCCHGGPPTTTTPTPCYSWHLSQGEYFARQKEIDSTEHFAIVPRAMAGVHREPPSSTRLREGHGGEIHVPRAGTQTAPRQDVHQPRLQDVSGILHARAHEAAAENKKPHNGVDALRAHSANKNSAGYCRRDLYETLLFFLKFSSHQRVRKCPTIPTPT